MKCCNDMPGWHDCLDDFKDKNLQYILQVKSIFYLNID